MLFIAQYVCYQLNVNFKLRCDRSHVVDLDSSSKQKFSRHLIFHLPNAVFTNNIQAGVYAGGFFHRHLYVSSCDHQRVSCIQVTGFIIFVISSGV